MLDLPAIPPPETVEGTKAIIWWYNYEYEKQRNERLMKYLDVLEYANGLLLQKVQEQERLERLRQSPHGLF